MLACGFFLSKVLIATSTLAWGVNFPAHLVIVKGTEYYDGKTRRYVDYPITGTITSVLCVCTYVCRGSGVIQLCYVCSRCSSDDGSSRTATVR